MKNIFVNICAALALTVFSGMTQADTASTTTAQVGETAPGFTLTDANGKTHSLSDFKGKYVVLEWVNYGCPFVKKHYDSGNMQKLQAQAAEKEVVWLAICSSAPEKQGYFEGEHLLEEIKAHESKAAAYLIDADGTVGQLYQAKTTPNMYVIDPTGVLIYAGAIDDKPTVDQADIPNSTNYVTAAIEASMAGNDVAVKATQPYGCGVKYSKK